MGLEEQAQTSPDLSDAEIDNLLTPAAETERPMSDPAPAEAAPTEAAKEPEYEYTWKDKKIKEPISQILKRAQQGYDYAQNMANFNKERLSFTEKQKLLETYQTQFKPVDDYIKQNPDWWVHVNEAWNKRGQTPVGNQNPQAPSAEYDPNNPLAREMLALKQQLGEVLEFKNQTVSEKTSQERAAQDNRLNEEILSIRKQYSNLDWSPGIDGKDLEYRVLEHAQQNNIGSFKAAFLSLNHDQLQKMAEERGKETVSKDIQKKTKLGLLGSSPTPRKAVSEATDIKNKSYEALYAEALDELGLR